ncbi:hypothetical protein [Mycobacterium sp. 236(2023)]|nr:hypothetical protein [Mycobacterium sp. 236(2023)]MDG4663197.1 hypothetical protein [Mycobacterium sp. 236(2023)]
MSAWFTPTTVDESISGAIEFNFGDGSVGSAVITEWERRRVRGDDVPR